jgi:hypothetical protein
MILWVLIWNPCWWWFQQGVVAADLVSAIHDEGDDGLILCESNTHKVMTVLNLSHCVHFGFAGIDAMVTVIKKICAFWRYVPILKCIVNFLCLHTNLILKRHWVFLWGWLALQGSHRFEVPSGHRMRITEGPSGLTSYYFPATGQGNPASFRWMEKGLKISAHMWSQWTVKKFTLFTPSWSGQRQGDPTEGLL